MAGSLFCVLGQSILQAYYYNSASINPGVQMVSSELNAWGGGAVIYYHDGLASHPGRGRNS